MLDFVFFFFFFFFNDTATTEIYTLSLHDALPISMDSRAPASRSAHACDVSPVPQPRIADRKSTRLNSSHVKISYAVFCLKKKKRPGSAKGVVFITLDDETGIANLVVWPDTFFFFNDTATTEIYTLSLHDALPIFNRGLRMVLSRPSQFIEGISEDLLEPVTVVEDRKSTRLNSSHVKISYAVF